MQRFDPVDYSYFYLATYKRGPLGGTWAHYAKYAGEVTYFSNGHTRYWSRIGGSVTTDYYAWNHDFHEKWGTPWPLGSTYTFDFAVDDGTTTLHAAPTRNVPPPRTTVAWSPPYCNVHSDWYVAGGVHHDSTDCYEETFSLAYQYASASGP
ncbi:MAG: hypothetical protein EXR72_18550 [Myxococcales bacterium]|nr:hypothetical protein [Myxococcales bacterium]